MANCKTKQSTKNSKYKQLNDKYEANVVMMKERNYLCSTLLIGFLRSELNIVLLRMFSKDVEILCAKYFDFSVPKLRLNAMKFSKLHRKSSVMEIHFDERYFSLYLFEQRLICRHILLSTFVNDYKTINIKPKKSNLLSAINYLSAIECVLSMHIDNKHKKIKKLNLSNLDLGDEDIWNLCKLIENVSNYHKATIHKSWSLDLEEIDLSNNNKITTKYLYLLSQKISKYLPKLINLDLNGTSIATKSIPVGLMQYKLNKFGNTDNRFTQKKRKKKKYKSGNWMS